MNKSSDSPRNRPVARGRARNLFETADARTKLVKQIVAAENAALDARTLKLRALRLAKEEADRAEALANPKPPMPAKKRRASNGSGH